MAVSFQACTLVLAAAVALIAIHLQGCGGGGGGGEACKGGAKAGENCKDVGCCEDSKLKCYQKDDGWASCSSSCTPGKHDSDPKEFRTPWSCEVVKPPAPTTTPPPVHGWVQGTWTTGYWDCCKPSCSWKGKGKVDKPVASCDIRTGKRLAHTEETSVCNKGVAATCTDMSPFKVNSGLSMGFAAAAVGEASKGLTGDNNCGQCFELVFTGDQHKGNWGGADSTLAGKRMIIQVTNIGQDVTGNHSFDILIPGAGQGIFTSGCTRQFSGHKSEDFDCGKNYGGCSKEDGCKKLPKEMQAGCEWRYEWYDWLKEGGKTNNPYVRYHRVKCPHQLVALSGTTPNDDGQHKIVV
mmetsp:Transcript_20099/g.62899  ORF Transcript_20099/g.62899 Transcript_20099/m.62899 type:complete len:351 (-) Transcript_20099:125-1177(-)